MRPSATGSPCGPAAPDKYGHAWTRRGLAAARQRGDLYAIGVDINPDLGPVLFDDVHDRKLARHPEQFLSPTALSRVRSETGGPSF
jgi:hypothetical protein